MFVATRLDLPAAIAADSKHRRGLTLHEASLISHGAVRTWGVIYKL